jgi:RNA polymerase sigma factor (sigma-70 family)
MPGYCEGTETASSARVASVGGMGSPDLPRGDATRDSHDSAKTADEGMRYDLIRSSMDLVHREAWSFRHCGIPVEDLVGEGRLGLVLAAERFDRERETKFTTYAIWWVRKRMLRALDGSRTMIHVPDGQRRRILHSPDAVLPRMVSLDARPRTADEKPLAERIPDLSAPSPEDRLLRQEVVERLGAALGILAPKERAVLALRFGLDDSPVLTLKDAGARLGMSRERVRQIESQAMGRLRKRLGTPGFRPRSNRAASTGGSSVPIRAAV